VRARNFFTEDGRRILDFLSGYCAGELGERLCRLAGGGLEEVYFGSSGSEGVEAAIKFARATTGRAGIV